MKIIGKVTILSFLVVTLTSCNRFTPTPTTISPTDIIATSAAIAKTAVVETQTAIVETAAVSTVTPLPSPNQFIIVTSTATPLGFSTATPVYWSPPPDKLDYAMTTAQKIYPLFPYINKANPYPYGEYSGCVETNDFQNLITYVVTKPVETIKGAFAKYFETERWKFTEPVSNDNIPTITSYDVYRISSQNVPAFEKLKVVLYDESKARGTDYVDVRVELTHIETKDNFIYVSNSYGTSICPTSWLWIRLNK